MLTVQKAIDLGITHALHGAPHPAADPIFLINSAGQQLVGMYRWEWCKRRIASLDARAGRDVIDLPDDFMGLNDIETIDNTSIVVRHISMAEMLTIRAQNILLPQSVYWVAETYLDEDNDPQRSNKAALLVYPTPETDTPGLFTINYRGGWAEVTNKNPEVQTMPLPADGSCDLLYITILRAVAKGFEEDDQRSLEMELERVSQGAVFRAAHNADLRRFENRGVIRNGLVETSNKPPRPFRMTLNQLPEGLDA